MSTAISPESVAERLRKYAPDEWKAIGREADVGETFCRKLVYGGRPNPRWKNLKAVAEALDRREGVSVVAEA